MSVVEVNDDSGIIYETDDGNFVISDEGGWLPGSYDTIETARYALEMDSDLLVDLRDRINQTRPPENRVITLDDLRSVE